MKPQASQELTTNPVKSALFRGSADYC